MFIQIYKPTTNPRILWWYHVLWDALIGFAVFSLFFGVFMNYFMMDYQVGLLGNFFKESINHYPDLKSSLKGILAEVSAEEIQKAKDNAAKEHHEVAQYNKKYETLFTVTISMMIIGILLILIVPVILGFIDYNEIPFKYLLFVFIAHAILILAFESMIFFGVMKILSPVKLYNLLDVILKNTMDAFKNIL